MPVLQCPTNLSEITEHCYAPFSSPLWNTSELQPWNPVVYCLAASFLAIGFWLVIELTADLYFTFKRHSGLYFWSILVSICGVAFLAVSRSLTQFGNASIHDVYLYATFELLWGATVVTGNMLMLYARLNLIIRDRRTLRIILGIILFDAVVFYLPTLVVFGGLRSQRYAPLIRPATQVFVTGTLLQENVLGFLYLWHLRSMLEFHQEAQKRRTAALLAGLQVLVLLLDVPLLVLQYMDMSGAGASVVIMGALDPAIYAFKLKIELAFLKQLVALVRKGPPHLQPIAVAGPVEEVRRWPGSERKVRRGGISGPSVGMIGGVLITAQAV